MPAFLSARSNSSGRPELDRATPKIITGKLAPARYVPSAATFIGTQNHIGRRCIADSGFDIWSDLFLAIVTCSGTVRKRSLSSITRE